MWNESFQMAIEEINAKGGIDGVLMKGIVEDHKSGDPKAGVSAYQKLTSIDKVPYIITTFSPPTLAIQPLAAEDKVLLVNPGAWSPKLENMPYLFNSRLTGSVLGEGIVRVAWDAGYRKIALAHPNDPSGITVANRIEEVWKKLGGEIVDRETADLGASDFLVQASKLRAANPEAVLTAFYTTDLGYLLKQSRDLGMKQPFLGMIWSGAIAKVAGKAGEGFQYVQDYWNPASPNPWTQRFVKAYTERTGNEPIMYAANTYEAVYLLRDLIVEAKKQGGQFYTGERLLKALLEKKTFDSVYGSPLTFRADGTSTKKAALYEVKEGKGAVVKELILK
jgi:branched-chain amino acid transport system substrate-binding protein